MVLRFSKLHFDRPHSNQKTYISMICRVTRGLGQSKLRLFPAHVNINISTEVPVTMHTKNGITTRTALPLNFKPPYPPGPRSQASASQHFFYPKQTALFGDQAQDNSWRRFPHHPCAACTKIRAKTSASVNHTLL